ncbi:MAG: FAD binding domain-containing protein [Ignavibacteriaceae bacterium]
MEKRIKFLCNDLIRDLSVKPGKALLDVIRQDLRLTGTKEGCKEGDCGACTVLLGEIKGEEVVYRTINSCLFPVAEAAGKHVVTVEGLQTGTLTPIQNLFLEEGASQCGFCTPGFVVSMTGHLLSRTKMGVEELTDSISGNLCRCTGHISIKRVVGRFAEWFNKANPGTGDYIGELVNLNLIPAYFSGVREKLQGISIEVSHDKSDSDDVITRVAGGTDLYVQRGEEIADIEVFLLNTGAQADRIKPEGNKIIISSLTTMSELEESEIINKYYPDLKNSLKYFGSRQIRNRATVGGNIRNASPIGDIANILLALEARLEISSPGGKRIVELDKFYISYKNVDCRKDEMITDVIIPIPVTEARISYEKVSKREYLDIASVNSTLYMEKDGDKIKKVRISAGGVAPIPLLLKKTADFLIGKIVSAKTVKETGALALSEISPISDARGSKEYKSLLLRQLIFAHFIKLFPAEIRLEELI